MDTVIIDTVEYENLKRTSKAYSDILNSLEELRKLTNTLNIDITCKIAINAIKEHERIRQEMYKANRVNQKLNERLEELNKNNELFIKVINHIIDNS